MEIQMYVTVPKYIHDIYADVAQKLGNFTTSQVMSAALMAYAQHLAEEVQAEDTLSGKDS